MATPSHRYDESPAMLEKQLDDQLAKSDSPFSEILIILANVCEEAAEHDLQTTYEQKLEDRLWNTHLKVNGRFRIALRQLRKEGNKRIVEFRKLGKDYEKFIKSSQGSYRGQIQKLVQAHGHIPALERVVRTSPPRSTINKQSKTSAQTQKRLLLSCHQNLIHLGDLSRYRETELSGKSPDWRPAIGYYDLADAIYPSSGTSHNQLAVMAQHDGDHFRATYHLYRAMAVDEPFPSARQNLDIEFRKVVSAHRKSRSTDAKSASDSAYNSLRSKFVLLHAVYFAKDDFIDQDELENEIIDLLAVELEKEVPTTLFLKMILTNLAAEFVAQHYAQSELRTWLHLLRLNVRTFNLLLRKFEVELVNYSRTLNQHLATTHALEVLMPGVRLYSSWILCNSRLVAGAIVNPLLQTHIVELWTAYASCLTFVARKFPPDSLTDVKYMLKEDEDTVGFKPLDSAATRSVWYEDAQKFKPKWSDIKESDRDASMEMLFRIRGMLLTGLQLALEEDTVPIALAQGTFVYQPISPLSPSCKPATVEHVPNLTRATLVEDEVAVQDMEASRMVDELVGTFPAENFESSMSVETLPESNDPPTPPEQDVQIKRDVVNTSSFAVGSCTAHDFMNTVFSPTKSQPQSPSRPSRQPLSSIHPASITVLQHPSRQSQPTSPLPIMHSRTYSAESEHTLHGSVQDSPWNSHQPKPVSPVFGNVSPLANESPISSGPIIALPLDGSVDRTYGISLFGIGNTAWTPSGPERKRLSADNSRAARPVPGDSWRSNSRPDS